MKRNPLWIFAAVLRSETESTKAVYSESELSGVSPPTTGTGDGEAQDPTRGRELAG